MVDMGARLPTDQGGDPGSVRRVNDDPDPGGSPRDSGTSGTRTSDSDAVEDAFERRRLSFGSTASGYDRYRPGYPIAAVRWSLGDPADGVRLRVVDLGAGTGRLGRAVADLGHEVTAVEPDPGMRAVAERVLPGRVLAGQAEAIPLPEGSADAVVAGQAYHWFDPLVALPEIGRVLVPGGTMAAVWNMRDDRVPWVRELSLLLDDNQQRTSTKVADLATGGTFVRAAHAQFEHTTTLDLDQLLGLVGTFSYVALSEDRAELEEAVRELVLTHPDVRGSDRYELPYLTHVFRAVTRSARTPSAGRPA